MPKPIPLSVEVNPASQRRHAYLESVTHLQSLWGREQVLHLVMCSWRGFETLAATKGTSRRKHEKQGVDYEGSRTCSVHFLPRECRCSHLIDGEAKNNSHPERRGSSGLP